VDFAMNDAPLFALGLTLAWLAGVRVYLTVFGVGLAGLLGWMELPPALHVCSSPWVLGTAGALALVEFCADKIPGVDSGWDLLHTLLRIPAGAFLAAATLSPDGHLGAAGLLLGGATALTSHALKTGTRALINTSPEPLSNWSASLGEDVFSLGALALAFTHPWMALTLAILAMTMVCALVLWMFRGLLRRLPRARPGRIPGQAEGA
jgi:hypothetical protein